MGRGAAVRVYYIDVDVGVVDVYVWVQVVVAGNQARLQD